VIVNRPRNRTPWLWLAGVVTAFTIGRYERASQLSTYGFHFKVRYTLTY